ncbi:hypothetical protein ACFV9E_20870 [Streptomyces sp. NPDC059835]|uniref:hypothetical protein n=1 Tax=Streptomyces sp. NPDC059835 TaxID=3346967 RepID=UPI003654B94F
MTLRSDYLWQIALGEQPPTRLPSDLASVRVGLALGVASIDAQVLRIHTVGATAEVTLHEHLMTVAFGLSPIYETGSGLREAADAAWSRKATYKALVSAAEDMERRAAS